MQKLYSLCKKRLQPLFCATAGILYMTMLTAQPVFAEDVATGGENIWSRFSTIMQDVYGELVWSNLYRYREWPDAIPV